jgi:hypothetical protein
MPLSLAAIRQTPQMTASQFLAAQPGCWVQYFDDTQAKDPLKALGARVFHPAVARRKQREKCAVCFSLQAFDKARTREELLCYRNLGVDVDLLSHAEQRALPLEEIDKRKDAYLEKVLWPFPLKPHWMIETRHGFHLVFRVRPQRNLLGIRAAMAMNTRLVRALKGDEKAALLTQVLRVPGMYQFKDPRTPFPCRLLLDNAAKIPPYDLDTMRSVLDAWEIFHDEGGTGALPVPTTRGPGPRQPRWCAALAGVPEGSRNAMAACLVGGILCRLPAELWEAGGGGGLKEWNTRNDVPLPERELRRVFESIARRELAKRGRLSVSAEVSAPTAS